MRRYDAPVSALYRDVARPRRGVDTQKPLSPAGTEGRFWVAPSKVMRFIP